MKYDPVDQPTIVQLVQRCMDDNSATPEIALAIIGGAYDTVTNSGFTGPTRITLLVESLRLQRVQGITFTNAFALTRVSYDAAAVIAAAVANLP